MSVSEQIQALEASRQAIAAAITQKGGTVAQGDGFSQFAAEISNLPSGGETGNPLLKSIDVDDFTGTTFNTVSNYITGVTIPNGVTAIVQNAFYGCSSLSNVNIPDSVTNIGDRAFQGCTSLTSVNIPDSVTSIGYEAFQRCNSISSMSVEEGNTKYDSRENCNAIIETSTNKIIAVAGTGFTIPSDVALIHYQAANYLTTETYPYNIVISKPTTPPSFQSGTYEVFGSTFNKNRIAIFVPEESVDAYKAESGWSTYSHFIDYEKPVLKINGVVKTNAEMKFSGNTLFYEVAKRLTGDIEVLDAITKIGTDSSGRMGFYHNKNITSVKFNDNITTFMNYCFNQCDLLTSVDFGSGVTDFGVWVFNECPKLTTVIVRATTPPNFRNNTFNNCPNLTAIYVPAESVDTYKAATNWSIYASIIQAIPEDVKPAFKFTSSVDSSKDITVNCEDTATAGTLTTNDLGMSSQQIDEFRLAENTGSVEIGDCVKIYMAAVCYTAKGISEVKLNEGLERIGDFAFGGMSALREITIPSTVTNISYQAFYADRALTSITCLATTPPTLGSDVFGDTGDCPIYVPSESVDAYKAATNWSTYASRIQAIPAE